MTRYWSDQLGAYVEVETWSIERALYRDEVAVCEWPPAINRAMDAATSSATRRAGRPRSGGATSPSPSLRAMHDAYGPDAAGRDCGTCAHLVVHGRRKHPRSRSGGTINIYRCAVHQAERPHARAQTWALSWRGCGRHVTRKERAA